jgi:DNA-binding response OmpR family regulator
MNAESTTILIVDDEELNSEGLTRRLQRHGYAVTAARSGREALELLGERRFDLVLLDIMMPEMDGLEVLKLLRRVDSLLALPIIMVTAKGESEDMVEALELGANDYVTKPFDFPVVLARIRTQLELRRAVARLTELEQKLAARERELEAAAKRAAVPKRTGGDLELAARVQQVFLPVLPREVPGARFAWAFRPCPQLAGDFLNGFQLDDQHLGLCLLGVRGQGVAAALLAAVASHLLIQSARSWDTSPKRQRGSLAGASGLCPTSGHGDLARAAEELVSPTQAARRLSEQLTRTAGQPLTLLYGILGLDTGEFRFVAAGHAGPVHLPRGAPPVRLEATGLPLGVGAGSHPEQAMNLRPGDRLVLYAAGVTEARNAEGEHFGVRRLLATLEQTRRSPLDKSLDALVERVEAWCEGAPRQQDIAIVFVERTDPAGVAEAPTAELPLPHR